MNIQVRSLARALNDLGVKVELFDPWEKYELDKFDLFHLFGANVGTYHLGRAIKGIGMKLVVTPVFYSLHTYAILKLTVGILAQLRKLGGVWSEPLFCKELCDMADFVIVNTRAELNLINKGLGIPEEKMGLVPNGVEKRFFFASPDLFVSKFGWRNFLLYVGHIGWGRKNLLPVLKVVKELGIPTVLIGTVIQNEYGKKCQEIIATTPTIKLIPHLEHSSPILESAYAACDTFVLPSLFETPGLSALEAGLAGSKICITRYGGTTEYFQDYATYLDPRSQLSIKNSLIRVLTQTKDDRLQKHILDNFLWEKCGNILYTHYRTILEGRR